MRKRGSGINSPEANFIFGGQENEQVHLDPEGKLMPYDRPTAAVDHVVKPENEVPSHQILAERDKAIAEIDSKIPAAYDIETDRGTVAQKLNDLSSAGTVDQQG